ncbi:hypothetical protein [Hyphomicrobium sp. LHD-15]|uniref:hypothetical protein n=1 Tax=Hyphomicrobium sp. LHD-15 TaxID=3072142 RepID=UPI00280FA824|nr:hypothetical protein [Hyphomicrobium sp. LHD-15]MDQ8699248.1 hypothetical protein [Hyphomicrobium sp. LHD-15]
MATLQELRGWEQQAKSYWLDALMVVDEMLGMHADDPDRGCLEALRDAQDEALQAGRKVRALQERIAVLEGPFGEFSRRRGVSWPTERPFATGL